MSDKLVVKNGNENIEVPILSSASKPRLEIKGRGYIPLELDGVGKGLYTKINNLKYKLLQKIIALKFSSDASFTLSVGTKGWDGTLEYTIDEGATWNIWDGSQLSGNATQNIYIRGTGNTIIIGSSSSYSWSFTGKYITGNIETLLDYNTVENGSHPPMSTYCYYYMFYNCTNLVTPPELPATTLANYCYAYMFYGCTSLTNAPALPANTLADYCYYYMFYSCKSLINAPELPATTLVPYCYTYMFGNCTSLTNAPELSATTLANYCYRGMFYNCTSLTNAPALPANTLAPYCYRQMFQGCKLLSRLPSLSATTLANYCYYRMFYNCPNIKLSETLVGDYQYEFRIPVSGTGTTASTSLSGMISGTGGTFTSDPVINTTYYTNNLLKYKNTTYLYNKGVYKSGVGTISVVYKNDGTVTYNSNNIQIYMATSGGTYCCLKVPQISLVAGSAIVIEYSISGYQISSNSPYVWGSFGYGNNLTPPSYYVQQPTGGLAGAKSNTGSFKRGSNLLTSLIVNHTGTYDIFIQMPQGYVDATNGTFTLHSVRIDSN